ncbi:hypothetical protein K227x_45130 [Rubripirellula lacrimiformis]|uniref:Uncharacterized protein n=1 Tax=Rubripirellula lacrimiformis TaxID=1930273 RepID=A0A517NG51_9BACT|nr:hypothetical protein K227x_45130 [Rubripirellula lacrimiformis]
MQWKNERVESAQSTCGERDVGGIGVIGSGGPARLQRPVFPKWGAKGWSDSWECCFPAEYSEVRLSESDSENLEGQQYKPTSEWFRVVSALEMDHLSVFI